MTLVMNNKVALAGKWRRQRGRCAPGAHSLHHFFTLVSFTQLCLPFDSLLQLYLCESKFYLSALQLISSPSMVIILIIITLDHDDSRPLCLPTLLISLFCNINNFFWRKSSFEV